MQRAQIFSTLESPSPPTLRGRLGEEYSEVTDSSVQSRVRARHGSKIASLEALGFQHFAFCLELLPPYSAISKLPLVLMMFGKEVLVFPKPARFGVGVEKLRDTKDLLCCGGSCCKPCFWGRLSGDCRSRWDRLAEEPHHTLAPRLSRKSWTGRSSQCILVKSPYLRTALPVPTAETSSDSRSVHFRPLSLVLGKIYGFVFSLRIGTAFMAIASFPQP